MSRRRAVPACLAAALSGLAWSRPAGAQDEVPPPPVPPTEAPVAPSPAAEAPRPPPAPPGRYYVGAEALWGSIGSRHRSIDGTSGAGLLVSFGTRLADHLALDVRFGGFFDGRVGPTPEISYPADRADYAFFLVGLVWGPEGGEAPVSPWLGAWLGYHSVQWKTYWYAVSGFGGSLGAGARLRLPLGFLQLGAILSLADARSTYDAPAGGTTSVILSGGWTLDWGR